MVPDTFAEDYGCQANSIRTSFENMAVVAGDLCVLDLGFHSLFGQLRASVPRSDQALAVGAGGGGVVSEDVTEDELLATLMPTWFSGIDRPLSDFEAEVDGEDITGLTGRKIGRNLLRHAMRLLVCYQGKAAQPDLAREDCNWDGPDRLTALLVGDGKDRVFPTLAWPGPVLVATACGTNSATVLRFGELGVLKLEVSMSDGGAAGEYWPPTRAVVACHYSMEEAVAADYYLWWARRLLEHGQLKCSPWHVFMAVVCARCWLSEVIQFASLILHEVAHADNDYINSLNPFSGNAWGAHCGYGCCQDHFQGHFKHRFWALFGAPKAYFQYGSGSGNRVRMGDEWWTGAPEGGSGGCESFSCDGYHCSTLQLNHYVTIPMSLGASCSADPSHEYEYGGPKCSFGPPAQAGEPPPVRMLLPVTFRTLLGGTLR